MERPFRAAFSQALGMGDHFVIRSDRVKTGPMSRPPWRTVIGQRTQADWIAVFDGIDACVTPVATMDEALRDGAFLARGAMRGTEGQLAPGSAPRFC